MQRLKQELWTDLQALQAEMRGAKEVAGAAGAAESPTDSGKSTSQNSSATPEVPNVVAATIGGTPSTPS
eukprot:2136522-Rhodomonas_salina.1